ncbi:MAG: FHA domain-containing protein, partial [Planctomycetota bacterium]
MSDLERATALVHKWIDGVLDEDEREELERFLNRDPEARRAYIHELKLHASLVLNLKGTGTLNFERQDMIRLTLETPEASSEDLAFDVPAVIIGRSNDAVLPIEDPKASRMHCQILRTSHGFELVDLGSSNGTLLNGKHTRRADLSPGDEIRIGNTRIVFQGDGEEAAAVDSSLSETPPEAIPVASLSKVPAPAPTLRKSSGTYPRPSSARLAAASPRSHLVPFLTFAAIFALFMVPVYIFVLRPSDETDKNKEGTSALKSDAANRSDEEWREFEKLDDARRRAQKEKEDEIKRKAEERWRAENEQTKRLATEEKNREAAERAAVDKEAREKEAVETARKKAAAEARAKKRAAEAEVFLKEKEAFKALQPDLSASLRRLDFTSALERVREFQ